MKNRDILNLHIHYMFNKVTIIILATTIILLIFMTLGEVNAIDKSQSYYTNIIIYFQSTFLYYKLFLSFITIFLFFNAMQQKSDFVIYFLMASGITKKKSIIIKIGVLFAIVFTLVVICFIIYSYSGELLIGFHIIKKYITAFLNLFLLTCFYGLFTMLLMQIVNNYLVIIIPIAILIITSDINYSLDLSIFLKILILIAPNLMPNGAYYYSYVVVIAYLLFLFVINVIIYCHRDLNY
ncbi:MAG: hypothetical protein WCR33_00870 [Bacilli bacterium]